MKYTPNKIERNKRMGVGNEINDNYMFRKIYEKYEKSVPRKQNISAFEVQVIRQNCTLGNKSGNSNIGVTEAENGKGSKDIGSRITQERIAIRHA